MADIRRLSWLFSRKRTIEDVNPGDISLVVCALAQEEKVRPRLVKTLARFPRIFAEYLAASEYTKERLNEFQGGGIVSIF